MLSAAAISLFLAWSPPVSAQALLGALQNIHETNPDLIAARHAVDATAETVNIAKAGRRPSAEISGSAGVAHTDYDASILGLTTDDAAETYVAAATITQPIYTGGRVRAGIAAATASVNAARSQLEALEQQVFLEAIAAYMDVVRDEPIVMQRQQNEQLIREHLTNCPHLRKLKIFPPASTRLSPSRTRTPP